MKILVVWMAAILFAAIPGSRAQLVNGGFEERETVLPNPYDDLAASWGRWGNWMNRESCWEPTHGGQCLMGYHHWKIVEPSPSGFYQDVTNAPPGSGCTFGIFVCKDPGTDAEYVELRLERIGGFQVLASQFYPMKELRSSWQRLTVNGTNDTAGVRVLVAIKPKETPGRSGALKFDDAELKVLPPGF